MPLELVTPLPPGAPSFTRLARHGTRLVVLREIKDGTDCSWPPPSPHLVTLQEVGELQGKRHALFDWVPGVTLREVLHALEVVGNPVPLGLVARVVIDAARAIDAISPARAHGGLQDGALQIGFDGKVSVLDFGAPRVTRFRPIGRVNFAADVFALGAVLHSALTGYQGAYATAPATLPPPSSSHPEVTPQLDAVIMRAISPLADSRQRDVGELADELEALTGKLLLSNDKLADVVQTLFRERIKLLQSLGGLVNATSAPSLEAELPMPGIPAGTQPGVGGPPPQLASLRDPAGAAASLPPRPLVPWDSSPDVGGEVSSEPTLPRVASSEVIPKVTAAKPNTVNLTPADDDDEQQERTAAVSRAELERAQRAASVAPPPPPPAPAPRAPVAVGEEPEVSPTVSQRRPSDEAFARVEAEDTNPRGVARPSADPGDTSPRVPKPVQSLLDQDTSPRGRPIPVSAAPVEDTGPTPSMGPRNTTEAERLRAFGQERLKTPPLGTPVVLDGDAEEEIQAEPTTVKPRPRADPRQTAQTAQTLPPATAESAMGDEVEEGEDAPRETGGGARWLIRIMALVVVGLMVGVYFKVKRQQAAVVAEPDVEDVVEAEDGGGELNDDGGLEPLVPVAALDEEDGGEEEDDPDGGEEEEEDAGVEPVGDAGALAVPGDGGTVDAGPADGGAPKKAPVKKVIKKKKKKKKWR